MSVTNKDPSFPERGRVLETTTMALVSISIFCLLTLVSSGDVDVEDQPHAIRAGTTFALRNYTSILTVPNGEKFGIWMWSELCPDNFYAVGFSLRVTISSTSSLLSSVVHICVC